MKKIIIANWKMNPQTLEEAKELYENFKDKEIIICPPFVYLGHLVSKRTPSVHLGAQDIFWEERGAFTGEISAGMLKQFNVEYVLVGHSDRRYVIGESDEVINKKIKACLKNNLIPVLLVGEREGENREEVLKKQLEIDLQDVSVEKVLIAYEPVWAISTNPNARADTPENTLEAVKFIMQKTGVESCLYGGSVSEKNILDFLKHPEVSGAVVGGASLRKEEFGKMLKLIS